MTDLVHVRVVLLNGLMLDVSHNGPWENFCNLAAARGFVQTATHIVPVTAIAVMHQIPALVLDRLTPMGNA